MLEAWGNLLYVHDGGDDRGGRVASGRRGRQDPATSNAAKRVRSWLAPMLSQLAGLCAVRFLIWWLGCEPPGGLQQGRVVGTNAVVGIGVDPSDRSARVDEKHARYR